MKIIKCPYCGELLEVPESAFGGNIRCCDCNCKFSWDNIGITLVEFPHREEVVGIEEDPVVLPTEGREGITFETVKRMAIRLFWPKGRATRHDFFSRYLCFFLLSLYFVPVTFTVIANMKESPLSCLWLFILIPLVLAAFWGETVVCVQRVNDIGWPGWAGAVYSVLGTVLIRVVGLQFIGLLFIVFLVGIIVIGSIRGTVGHNRYGEDPKQRNESTLGSGVGQGAKNRVRFSFLRVGLGLIIAPIILYALSFLLVEVSKNNMSSKQKAYLENKEWYQRQLEYYGWSERRFTVEEKHAVLLIRGMDNTNYSVEGTEGSSAVFFSPGIAPGFAKELLRRRYDMFKYENEPKK